MAKNLEVLRAKLLQEAREASTAQGLAESCLHLEALVAVMKERSRTSPELSSLYFAGASGDYQ